MPTNVQVHEHIKAANRLENDPIYFIEDILGNTLWDKQSDIALSVAENKRTTVRSCHNVGKTYIAARIALWFLATHEDSIVVTTAPTFRQVEDLLWREIRKAYAQSQQPIGGDIFKTKLEISEKWFAIGISTDEPERFQGIHAPHILIIVDEAAGVSEEIFQAIEGSLSNEGAKLLLIGNPTSLSGTFYHSHRDPAYHKIHISAFDSPNIKSRRKRPAIPGLIAKDWIEEMQRKWGEDSPMYQARVLGDFPEQGTDTLIPLNKIEAAIYRDLPETPEDKYQIGVDVARFGSNKTVFVCRKGNTVVEIKKFGLKDTMETTGALIEFMSRFDNPPTKVDNVGIGAGVVDRLRELKKSNAMGVNVGSKPRETDKFTNLRAEHYWRLRDLFIEGKISIPNDQQLAGELANIKYRFTSQGLIEIESKEQMSKRGIESPDIADALALAFIPGPSRAFRFEVIGDDDDDDDDDSWLSDPMKMPPSGWMNRVF